LNRFDASDQRRTPFDDRCPVNDQVADDGRGEKIAGVNARQSEGLVQANGDQRTRREAARIRERAKRRRSGMIAGKMIGGNRWPPAVIGNVLRGWMKREGLIACLSAGASVGATQGIRSSASLI
jgi:hypothetical protein